jgi:dTDP-4-dehydrorhamnose reductase
MAALRIVIIGTGGRLGGALARHFRLRGNPVVAFDRKALDLTRPEMIRDRLEPLSFDAVILSGAMTQLDECEEKPAAAEAANVAGPRLIGAICAARKARLIHISTDYVYEGTIPGHKRETDPAGPISTYARTKFAGEQAVREMTNGAALVVRTSWVFGPDRPAFPDQLLARAKSSDSVEGIADKFSVPTSSREFCEMLEPFLVGDFARESGLLNICNDGIASWHTYGQCTLELAAGFGMALRARTVVPRRLAEIAGLKAPRPVHTAMSVDKVSRLLGRRPRAWQEALADYLRTYYTPGN